MDALRAFRKKIQQQQLWVRISCYGVIGVTVLLLFLSMFGAESANVRSTGLMAFSEDENSSTSLFGRHVERLKEASNKIVNTFWSTVWRDVDDDVLEDELLLGAIDEGEGEDAYEEPPPEEWTENTEYVEGGAANRQEDTQAEGWDSVPSEDWQEASVAAQDAVLEPDVQDSESHEWPEASAVEVWEAHEWPQASAEQDGSWGTTDEAAYAESASTDEWESQAGEWEAQEGDASEWQSQAEQWESKAAAEQEWKEQAEQWESEAAAELKGEDHAGKWKSEGSIPAADSFEAQDYARPGEGTDAWEPTRDDISGTDPALDIEEAMEEEVLDAWPAMGQESLHTEDAPQNFQQGPDRDSVSDVLASEGADAAAWPSSEADTWTSQPEDAADMGAEDVWTAGDDWAQDDGAGGADAEWQEAKQENEQETQGWEADPVEETTKEPYGLEE